MNFKFPDSNQNLLTSFWLFKIFNFPDFFLACGNPDSLRRQVSFKLSCLQMITNHISLFTKHSTHKQSPGKVSPHFQRYYTIDMNVTLISKLTFPACCRYLPEWLLRPRQNGRHFPDDILKWIFLNENVWIPIKISLKFVPSGPINNIPQWFR